MKRIMLVFGKVYEAIKMCSLVNRLKKRDRMNLVACMTRQRRRMLDQVLNVFDVKANYGFPDIKEETDLLYVTINISDKVKQEFRKENAVSGLVNENIILKTKVCFDCI